MRSWWSQVLVVASLGSTSALAAPHTASGWLDAGLQLRFDDRISVAVDEQLRLDITGMQIDELNTTLEAAWRLERWLELGAHYRLDVEGWGDKPFTDHRFGLDAQVGGVLGKLQLTGRQRVQPELASSRGEPFRVVLRTRLRARHALSEQLQPYLAVEPYLVASSQVWDRLRFDVGFVLPDIGLDVSYRLDQPLGRPGAPHHHILTFSFTGRLDLRADDGREA